MLAVRPGPLPPVRCSSSLRPSQDLKPRGFQPTVRSVKLPFIVRLERDRAHIAPGAGPEHRAADRPDCRSSLRRREAARVECNEGHGRELAIGEAGRPPGEHHGAGRSGRESMPPRRLVTLRRRLAGQPPNGLRRQRNANMTPGPAPAPAQVDAGRGHVGACRGLPQSRHRGKCGQIRVCTCARRVRTSSTRQHRVAVEHGPDLTRRRKASMPSPAPLTRHPSHSGTHRPRSARRTVARATRADRATVPGRLLSGNPGSYPLPRYHHLFYRVS